jgi:hypothetical protein
MSFEESWNYKTEPAFQLMDEELNRQVLPRT